MRIRAAIITVLFGLLVFGAVSAAVGQPLEPAGKISANKRAAHRDVRRLMGRLVLPPGATVASRDPGEGVGLATAESEPATSTLVDVHRFWRVPGAPSAALAWFQAHVPAGSSLGTSGTSSGPGYVVNVLGFDFPAVTGVLESRELAVSITAARGGGTAVRADAEDVWYLPRPSSERVPAGVQLIDVNVTRLNPSNGSRSTSTMTVSTAAAVKKVVSLVNALPRAQPGAFSCPVDFGPDVTLKFLSAPGTAPLAVATAQGSGCGTVTFTLAGKSEPPLSGGTLVRQLEKLLGFTR
jgi:hypothetical protein